MEKQLNKKKTDIMKTEIDYKTCAFTDRVAYVIHYVPNYGNTRTYTSPFVFNSVDDAYHAACIEISGK